MSTRVGARSAPSPRSAAIRRTATVALRRKAASLGLALLWTLLVAPTAQAQTAEERAASHERASKHARLLLVSRNGLVTLTRGHCEAGTVAPVLDAVMGQYASTVDPLFDALCSSTPPCEADGAGGCVDRIVEATRDAATVLASNCPSAGDPGMLSELLLARAAELWLELETEGSAVPGGGSTDVDEQLSGALADGASLAPLAARSSSDPEIGKALADLRSRYREARRRSLTQLYRDAWRASVLRLQRWNDREHAAVAERLRLADRGLADLGLAYVDAIAALAEQHGASAPQVARWRIRCLRAMFPTLFPSSDAPTAAYMVLRNSAVPSSELEKAQRVLDEFMTSYAARLGREVEFARAWLGSTPGFQLSPDTPRAPTALTEAHEATKVLEGRAVRDVAACTESRIVRAAVLHLQPSEQRPTSDGPGWLRFERMRAPPSGDTPNSKGSGGR